MKWTSEQERAITTKPNLLVNAAAGSGKTAVLVERITRMLIPDSVGNYIGVDRLLVVTFARDAAREMQERMKKSLREAFNREKDKERKAILKKQLKKLPFAEISTIDSFCVRLVRQNFHILGIDPKFKIADPSENKIFQEEAMNEYFDALYEEGNKDFFLLTRLYSRGYDDKDVMSLLLEAYEFTRSVPDPDNWLVEHAKDYESFSGSIFCTSLENQYKSSARDTLPLIKTLCSAFEAEANLAPDTKCMEIYNAMKNDIEILSFPNPTWDYISGVNFQKFAKTGLKKAEADICKRYIDLREQCLAQVKKLAQMASSKVSDLDREYKEELYPHALAISNLVLGFSDFLWEKKRKLGRFSFNDLEHMTLQLLRSHEDITQALKEKYAEILMDEYQDTNSLQEEIFSLISNGTNRFVVGDMKQSIYRFRNSDPLIFRARDEDYLKNPNNGSRIMLSKNFRSRKTVLDSINLLFSKIMTYRVGEVDYTDEQALHFGNPDLEKEWEGNDYSSELHIIEGGGGEDDLLLTDEEKEAELVASKIREMLDSGWLVTDKGKQRPVRESDFAILMSSVKSHSATYINALGKYGISGYSEDNGFFEKTEIRLITELVKAVNNPQNDISLVSVMRSPVYRFTDDELAQIRLSESGSYWDCVNKKAEDGDTLGEKCKSFAGEIKAWREKSEYMSADRLIWRLMTDCSLYDICGILYGGEKALANLRLYMERARTLSEGTIATLYDFEQYMSRMESSDGLGCANIGGFGVPIMTIHKSKGLEFPVVFVCGMGTKFMNDGFGKKLTIHKDLGFGLDNINTGGGYSLPTVNKKVILARKKSESISEQLRKLYVAFTRAKEKLIVTAVVPASKNTGAFEFTNKEMTEEEIENATSYVKIIAPVIKQSKNPLWTYHEYEAGTTVSKPVELAKEERGINPDDIRDSIFSLLDKYSSFETSKGARTKTSVSDLKGHSGFSAKLQRLPSFMNTGQNGGAEFGTLVHKVMEKINITESIPDEVIRITGEENKTIVQKVTGFFESPLGVRALKCNIKREAPFEIQIPATDSHGTEIPGETMLLQGVIDMYFEEDGEIVLVDYKTDKCKNLEELSDKYSVQLYWYRQAIKRLLKKEVKEVFIYSFYLNDFIEIRG